MVELPQLQIAAALLPERPQSAVEQAPRRIADMRPLSARPFTRAPAPPRPTPVTSSLLGGGLQQRQHAFFKSLQDDRRSLESSLTAVRAHVAHLESETRSLRSGAVLPPTVVEQMSHHIDACEETATRLALEVRGLQAHGAQSIAEHRAQCAALGSALSAAEKEQGQLHQAMERVERDLEQMERQAAMEREGVGVAMAAEEAEAVEAAIEEAFNSVGQRPCLPATSHGIAGPHGVTGSPFSRHGSLLPTHALPMTHPMSGAPPVSATSESVADDRVAEDKGAEDNATFLPPPGWTLEGWLNGLSFDSIVSNAILRRVQEKVPVGASTQAYEQAFLARLGERGSVPTVLALLQETPVLHQISSLICERAAALHEELVNAAVEAEEAEAAAEAHAEMLGHQRWDTLPASAKVLSTAEPSTYLLTYLPTYLLRWDTLRASAKVLSTAVNPFAHADVADIAKMQDALEDLTEVEDAIEDAYLLAYLLTYLLAYLLACLLTCLLT